MINRLQEEVSTGQGQVVYSFIPYVARSSKISSKDNVHSTDIESMLGNVTSGKKKKVCIVERGVEESKFRHGAGNQLQDEKACDVLEFKSRPIL